MMKRDTLNKLKWQSRKMSFYPTAQHVQQLVDSHLEALDKISELQYLVNNTDKAQEA